MQNFVLRYSVVRLFVVLTYLFILKPIRWFGKLLLSPPWGVWGIAVNLRS